MSRWCTDGLLDSVLSFQALQIIQQRVEIVGGKLIRRHADTGLQNRCIQNPAGQITASIRQLARRDHFSRGDMCKIGPKGGARLRSLDGVTHHTSRTEENIATTALGIRYRLRCGFLLCLQPAAECVRGFGDKDDSHVGMLLAAILRTLPPEFTSSPRCKPCCGGMPRNEILFPVNVRYPEAVNHVTGLQLQLYG